MRGDADHVQAGDTGLAHAGPIVEAGVKEHTMGTIHVDRLKWLPDEGFSVWHFSAKCSCGAEVACYGNRPSDGDYLHFYHERHVEEAS